MSAQNHPSNPFVTSAFRALSGFGVFVFVVACSPMEGAEPRGTFGALGGGGGHGGGSTGSGGAPVDLAAPLFDVDVKTERVRIDIELTQSAIDMLKLEPKTFTEGRVVVRVGDQTIDLPAVGVRLRGHLGFRTLEEKASFLLDFNKYTEDQTLLGLGKLVLGNMVQDPGMICERLGYRLFREMNVPAPRSGYANVYVNGKLYGLYSTVESVDNDTLLDRWFGADTGNLYEGEYGADLVLGQEKSFDQDNGADVGHTDLTDLALALDGMNDPQRFVTDVAEIIDFDRYLRFVATEMFLGHWDGYSSARNNYYVHRLPSGRWTFLPWGADQLFYQHIDPFHDGGGRLHQLCMASNPCRLKLAQALEDVMARAVAIGMKGEVIALKEILWNDIVADPRKEYDTTKAENKFGAIIDYLDSRPGILKSRLACADLSFVIDEDQDGSNACHDDCDDSDPTIYTGAQELCNLADENCNGLLDDDPVCPKCVFAPAVGGGGTFAVCFEPATWADAEADCIAQGGHLASIHDATTQEMVTSKVRALPVLEHNFWLGLHDTGVEGSFVWTDGTPVDISFWAKSEPNGEVEENCVHLTGWAGGGWNDSDCANELGYVCRLP